VTRKEVRALPSDFVIRHSSFVIRIRHSSFSTLATDRFFKYRLRLKAFALLFLSAGALFLAGCADPLEQGTVQEVPEKFQRGITGNGQLQSPDRSLDPTIGGNHP
jgi:hypothetical protein